MESLEFRGGDEKDDYIPLAPLENTQRFIHDPNVAHIPDKNGNIRYTELERTIIKAFDDAVAILMAEYPTELNFHAIKNYLREPYDAKDKGNFVGLFMIQIDPVTSKFESQVWQWADTIAAFPSSSQKIRQIQLLVDTYLIRHIFENPKKFFTVPISIKGSILNKWPSLHDIPLIPNWLNPLN